MLLFFTLTSQGYYDFMNYTIYYINNISYSYSFIMIRLLESIEKFKLNNKPNRPSAQPSTTTTMLNTA